MDEDDFSIFKPFGGVILRRPGLGQHHPRRRLASFFNEFWKQLEAFQKGETFLGVGDFHICVITSHAKRGAAISSRLLRRR